MRWLLVWSKRKTWEPRCGFLYVGIWHWKKWDFDKVILEQVVSIGDSSVVPPKLKQVARLGRGIRRRLLESMIIRERLNGCGIWWEEWRIEERLELLIRSYPTKDKISRATLWEVLAVTLRCSPTSVEDKWPSQPGSSFNMALVGSRRDKFSKWPWPIWTNMGAEDSVAQAEFTTNSLRVVFRATEGRISGNISGW